MEICSQVPDDKGRNGGDTQLPTNNAFCNCDRLTSNNHGSPRTNQTNRINFCNRKCNDARFVSVIIQMLAIIAMRTMLWTMWSEFRKKCGPHLRGPSKSLVVIVVIVQWSIVCPLVVGMGLGESGSLAHGSIPSFNALTSNDNNAEGGGHLDSDDNTHHNKQDHLANSHLNENHVREPFTVQHDMQEQSNAISRNLNNGPTIRNWNNGQLAPQALHNSQLLNLTRMLQELDQGCSSYCTEQSQFDSSVCVNNGCRNWKAGLKEGCSYVCNESENNYHKFYACQRGCSKAIEEYYFRVTGLIGVPDPPTLTSDSLKSSSVGLSWEGSALPLPYLVFTVQRRLYSGPSQWETIPSSSQQPLNTTTFTVKHLQPYTQYQFRVGWILAHEFSAYYSRESNPIETLAKGLPNPPQITSIQPISNTSVSVTWLAPSQPNGRLIAYILKLRELPDGHIIIKEIPISQDLRGYTFTSLRPITNYSLEISAQNVEGEGDTANIHFVTPQSSLSNAVVSEKPEARLLLQGIKDVYIQHLDLLLYPDVYVYNSSLNISAIASHFKRKWIFIATGDGDIIRTGLENETRNALIVPKEQLDLIVSFLAVDWMHNHLYIVGKNAKSSNWFINRCDLNGKNLITIYSYLFEKPVDFAADPYTGYLYWVSPSTSLKRGGLFKLDLMCYKYVNASPIPVIESSEGESLGPFVVDPVNYRILIVHKGRNTVLAVSLDGDVTDIRRNTQSPQFEKAQSLAMHNGIFYWTTGENIVVEEYNAVEDSYYQNSYDVAKVHQPCSRVVVVHPDLQPIPVPMAPPQRVQVIYGQTRGRVSWRPPPVISGLGEGSWRHWKYNVRIADNNVTYEHIRDNEVIIQNLRPSTFYTIQVQASSDGGAGPWSPPVRGKTLRESHYNVSFLWGSQSGLYTTNTLGDNVQLLASPSISTWSDLYMSSLAWFDSVVFFSLSNGSVFYYDATANSSGGTDERRRAQATRLPGVSSAQSIAFDYIGQKLYWSNPKEQSVLRCSFIEGSVGVRNSAASNVETVNPCTMPDKAERLQLVTMARDIAVDSCKGLLLWSTGHSLEVSRLNGYSHRTLFQSGLFSGVHIMGITLDTEESRIYWITRSSSGCQLQRLNYNIHGAQLPMIIDKSVESPITGPIRYFNDRLIWLQGSSEAVIRDLPGQRKSSLTIGTIQNITNVHVRDQSPPVYPKGLSRHKIQVYPDPVLKWTIVLSGKWDNFTISWNPVNNTNVGEIMYEVVVNNSISKITSDPNITIDQAPFKPYTELEVSVTPLTYWASSKSIIVRLKTPSWRPSAPRNPRVFVQKLAFPYVRNRVTSNLSNGQGSVSVRLRWDVPASPNGLILGYVINCWKDAKKTDCMCDVDMSSLEHPSCEIQHLFPGTQLYFEIQAYTEAGAGNFSSRVLADTSFNTPLPRLLLTSSDNNLKTFDIDRNKVDVITPYTKAITAGYLASEDTVFWFDNRPDLMRSRVGSSAKPPRILTLSEKLTVGNLVVEWIGRKLYWAFEETLSSSYTDRYGIMELDLAPSWSPSQEPKVVLRRPTPVHSVAVDPLYKRLVYTVTSSSGQTTLYASDLEAASTRPFLSTDRDSCSCQNLSSVGKPIAYDAHGFGENSDFPSGFLLVDNQYIWLSDTNGCNCSKLAKHNSLPYAHTFPIRLAADEHRVYWTVAGGKLFASEKKGNGGVTQLRSDVREVVSFGRASQPFPPVECLIPDRLEFEEPLFLNSSSHSITFQLPRPKVSRCRWDVALPTPKYNVIYGTADDGDGISKCTPSSLSFCKVVNETTENILHITSLQPYTTYAIFVNVTNYYAELRGDKPLNCNPTMRRTAAGAPMPPTLLRLEVLSPTSVRVVWRRPEKLNGEKVWYQVQWNTTRPANHNSIDVSTQGHKWAELVESRSNPGQTEYSLQLDELHPATNYSIWVYAYSEKGDAFKSSRTKFVSTLSPPNNITLSQAFPHNLTIFWKGDSHIIRHQIMYREGWSSQNNFTFLPEVTTIPAHNYTLNITNLKPKMLYGFRIKTWYAADPSRAFIWPSAESQFSFETRADKPGKPGMPFAIRASGASLYEVRWEKGDENGDRITCYELQYKAEPKEKDGGADLLELSGNSTNSSQPISRGKRNAGGSTEQLATAPLAAENVSPWLSAYNGTRTTWHVENSLDKNRKYSFRVRANNSYGWGEFSEQSLPVSLAQLAMVAGPQTFGIILGSIFLACLTLGSCAFFTLFLYRGKLKEKPILNSPMSSSDRREVELATLRELPDAPTFIRQSNILYAGDLLLDMDFAGIPKIPRHKISFTKFLGSGAFGEVYEGIAGGLISPHEDTRVAIKTLRKGASNLEKMEFVQEAKLMIQFQHPHIIQLLGICVDTDPCCLLLELMGGGDLLSYLRSHRPSLGSTVSLTIVDLLRMCVDVAKGCVYLEDMHFVHRDLAARNCLVQLDSGAEGTSPTALPSRVVKIGDFGLARDIYRNDYYRKEGEGLLPVRWMAPESLVDGVFTTQSDVWAFGVLLWEIITLGQQPYPARNNIEVLHYVHGGGRLHYPLHCPQSLSQLMVRCWEYNPDNRPSFKDCQAELEYILRSYQSILNASPPSQLYGNDGVPTINGGNEKEEEDEYGFCPSRATEGRRLGSRSESTPKYIEVIGETTECRNDIFAQPSRLITSGNEGYEVPLPRKPPRRKALENRSVSSGSPSSHSLSPHYGLPSPKYWNVDLPCQSFQRCTSASSNLPLLHSNGSTSLSENRNQAFLQDSLEDVEYTALSCSPDYHRHHAGSSSTLQSKANAMGSDRTQRVRGSDGSSECPTESCTSAVSRSPNDSPIYTYSYSIPTSGEYPEELDYHRVAASLNAPSFSRQTIDTCGSG